MADDKYVLELDMDASPLVRGMASIDASTQRTVKSLTSLGVAMKELEARGTGLGRTKNASWMQSYGLTENQAKALTQQVTAMKKASDAAASFGKAASSLKGVNITASAERQAKAITSMGVAMKSVVTLASSERKELSASITIYNQAAAAARNVASADQARARAIAAVQAAQATELRASGMTAYQEQLIAIKQQGLELAKVKEQRITNAAAERAAAKQEKANAAEAVAAERARKKAIAESTAAEQKRLTALENSRFASRELARAYTSLGVALGALPAAGTYFAASQERAFADVQRTTQESLSSLSDLRSGYQELSTEIPISFEELSDIGTLGAQMDIPKDKLADFTEAVGDFAAITGVSVDTAAMGFGRLDNMLDASQRNADEAGNTYSILASQVAELGAKSVATESEILNTAQSIATTASVAGMSQDEVLGYSAALASLKVPAEWARGSMQRIFGEFNTAVADGGDDLAVFANKLGVTSDQAADLWRNDPSKFFNQLLVSIQNAGDGVAQWNAIQDMGFTNTRDVQMLQRLANGYDVVAQALESSAEAGKDASFLHDSMEIISQTASATFTRLANAFKNFLAGFGEGFLEPIKLTANAVIAVLNALNSLPSGIKTVVASFAGISAIVLLFRGLTASLTGLAGSAMNVTRRMAEVAPGAKPGLSALRAAWNAVFVEIAKVTAEANAAKTAQVSGAAASTAAVRGESAAQVSATAATTAGTAATVGATTAAVGFRTVAGSLFTLLGGWPMVIAGVATAAISLGTAWYQSSQSMKDSSAAADDLLDKMGGTTTLANAIVQDTMEAADGTQTATSDMVLGFDAQGDAATGAQAATKYWVDELGNVVTATEETAESLGYYTVQIGNNTKAALLNAVQNGKAWTDMSTDTKNALVSTGFTLTNYIATLSDKGDDAGKAYVQGFLAPLESEQATIQAKMDQISTTAAANRVNPMLNATYRELTDKNANLMAQIDALKGVLGADGFGQAAQDALAAAKLTGSGFEELSEGGNEAKDSVVDLTDSISSFIDEAFAGTDAAASLGEAMMNLADSIAENGTSLDPNSEAGRANLSAVKDYFNAVADEATAGINELGLTGTDAQNYMYDMIQQATDFLGQQGFDVSSVQNLANKIYDALGFTVSPGIDDTNFTSTLNNMLTNAQNTFNQIAAIMSSGVLSNSSKISKTEALTKTGSLASGNNLFAKSSASTKAATASVTMNSSKASTGSYTKPTLDTSGFKRSASRSSGSGGSGGSGGNGGSGGGSKATKDATKTAAEQFEDFISRLSTAMKEAIDKFWASSDAADAYHKSLNSLSKSVQDTKDKIEDLRKSNASLTTDLLKDQQTLHDAQFYNQIATKYGDTERMTSTQTDIDSAKADIADKNAQIAANNKEAASLQAGMYALTGYSEAAIANRAAIKDMQTQMVGLIEDYAESGASTEQVTAYTAQLKQEFINQVTQLGFNRAETIKLAGAFDSLSQSIKSTPRTASVNVTDNGSVNATQNKINGIKGGNVGVGTYASDPDSPRRAVQAAFDANHAKVRFDAMLGTTNISKYLTGKFNDGGLVNGHFAGGGKVPGNPPSNRSADNVLASGPGGLYAIRSGEFVQSQPAVDYYGPAFMEAINSMQVPIVNVSTPVSTGAQPVMLMPNQIAQIAQAVSSIVIVGNDTVARASNAGNVNTGNRGTY